MHNDQSELQSGDPKDMGANGVLLEPDQSVLSRMQPLSCVSGRTDD